MVSQALGHVVGVKNRNFRGAAKSGAAHHADIHPGNRQDAGAAVGGCRYRIVFTTQPINRLYGVIGQKGSQVGFNTDRSHAWAATTVGNTKCLV